MTSTHHLPRRGFLAAAVLASATALAGCATQGTPFNASAVSNLQPGVTTLDEAIRLLGQPHAVTSQANGTRTAMWMYAESTLGTGKTDQVLVDFDSRGLMLRPVQRTHTRY